MNSNSKVLHISNWYPSEFNPYEGVFIKEQFGVFKTCTNATLINVQVRNGDKIFKIISRKYNSNEKAYFIVTSIKSWKVIEFFSTLLLVYVLYKEKANKYNLLHIHIAYPLLRHYRWWKRLIRVPVIISEHWSAYHFHFNMNPENRKLENIRSIFRHKIPVITVSRSLQNDIYEFARNKAFKSYVLPNILDLNIFKYNNLSRKKEEGNQIQFFMVNFWRSIKNPFPILAALKVLVKDHPELYLTVGGYGDLLNDMKRFVSEGQLEEHVVFTGKMGKTEIAEALSNCDAYLFSSDYETFSVACAQALCCGVPLIGPSIEAIREYADANDGIFMEQNTAEEWQKTIKLFVQTRQYFNREEIAKKAKSRFSVNTFRDAYLLIVDDIICTKRIAS